MAFYDTNPNFRAQPYEEPAQAYMVEQEKKRYAAMAQQQERFGGPQVSKPMDLASVLQTYENLLGGLIDQIDALEHRLSPLLLDYSNGPVEPEKEINSTGSPVTTRVYQLNSTLRVAAERVARITQSVNL